MSDTLGEVLEAAAGGLDGPAARARSGDGSVEFRRGERPFAVLEPDGRAASFRLSTAVASAALRTPDTTASPRGQGWVTLRPVELDGHAVDRATAWFESAWRASAN